jgi:hypothetical protein
MKYRLPISSQNIRLRGPTCRRSNENKVTSGQCKHRGRVETQQSMESQRPFIKAPQHTHTSRSRPPDRVPRDRSTSQNIRLHGPTCQRSNENKVTSGQCKHRGRVQTQQSMESQRRFIKAPQHTHITKQATRSSSMRPEYQPKHPDTWTHLSENK